MDTDGHEPIIIGSNGPPLYPGRRYLERLAAQQPCPSSSSELLSAIKAALRGTSGQPDESIHTEIFSSDELGVEEELAWDEHTVVWSSGGNQKCKWNLEEEGQRIQWACVSWLYCPGVIQGQSTNSAARYTSINGNEASLSSNGERDTFSPFTRARQANQKIAEPPRVIRAVFVFLRSLGRIYMTNGITHTFSLPFIVRKAWPLFPHGVLIQRVLDREEVEEAEITGDFTLPTLFTVTNPFSEPRAVGLTDGIKGGFGNYRVILKDGDPSPTKPLKSIPADEQVIWVSTRLSGASDDLIATVDTGRRYISIWHYVYLAPKDIPVPLGHRRARSLSRRRTSVSGAAASDHRQGGVSQTLSDRAERIAPLSPDPLDTEELQFPDFPPLSAIPDIPPSLISAATLSSMPTTSSVSTQWSNNMSGRGRRNSLTRNDLSVTMDKMALGKKPESDISLAALEHGRMTPAYWAERLYRYELSETEREDWQKVQIAFFDQRYDGETDRSYGAICLPSSKKLLILKLTREKDTTQSITHFTEKEAISATAVRATRNIPWDLLIVSPEKKLYLLMHGLQQVMLDMAESEDRTDQMVVDGDASFGSKPIYVRDPVLNSVTIGFDDKTEIRTTLAFFPPDVLTNCCLCALGAVLPSDVFFNVHLTFLQLWSKANFGSTYGVEFDCFDKALTATLGIDRCHEDAESMDPIKPPWYNYRLMKSYGRLRDDTALLNLELPPSPVRTVKVVKRDLSYYGPTLVALHTLAENLRLQIHFHKDLLKLAPLICRIAQRIRPGWAEYWHRLCPEIEPSWRRHDIDPEFIDYRLAMWPTDYSASLLMRFAQPDYPPPTADIFYMAYLLNLKPSYAFGRTDPYACLHEVSGVYSDLAYAQINEARKRCENAVVHMTKYHRTYPQLSLLVAGVAAPLREAARTCQLYPPPEWPLVAYEFIGRNDLSEGALSMNDLIFADGYTTVKEHTTKKGPRKSFKTIFDETHRAVHGDQEAVTGVELELESFTDIRFGQDRRLYEVARILSSTTIPHVRMVDRPDLNEHDLAKEQQAHVIRTAERTLSLPLGRAIFTYGSLPSVSRELYVIPKIELSIRLQPQNTVITPEPGKISVESTHWAEFHNGVAAGLRISPSSKSIDSSWIAFNKPQDLSPEHAGFLYGLGLNGHLKDMLTWHTFGYLTPKHDMTSVGVLLGLSAANVGNGNRHVTKLIAVHLPALLPTPAVDLNVPLLTQAAGLVGIGLLYMGTKNRRMAEMTLYQISRRDLLQPDLSNEHREAYTTAAALAFGMIMVGKGSQNSSPVDLALLSRLRILIHGEGPSMLRGRSPSFDVNLTSPAASIALGLMYLRTHRTDIADILTIPNTVLGLNSVQPSFLLVRTIARAIIMWDNIKPNVEWLVSLIPPSITKAMEARQKGLHVDDAIELAYYHIVSGGCMAVGLKYAGTASHDAYMFIINSYDLFSRFAHTPGPSFDQKIKRSAIRDGLNTISIALNMVMAGTAEINCLRRLRFAHGMNGPVRYGSHMATHMSLGLLFLGVGRYTLGTSDAAVACMMAAFYPRYANLSSDNKCFLQALRHLWVLAVEPRCLIARDVDTKEIVYLPMKIRVREDNATSSGTQLISPSLIPGIERLAAVKVDTPRYWPFYLDVANIPRHREALLRSQTLLVKRHTAFLSYLEDPKGSRSLYVRSGSSTSNAAALDFPQHTDVRAHPAGDLEDFITSTSNDTLFTSFADRFCRGGETEDEKTFMTFCHAVLLDSILQGKPQTIQTHLLLHRARVMSPKSRYFNLMLQDLRFLAEFYSKVYERKISGKWDTANGTGVYRSPLLRESTILSVLKTIDAKLEELRKDGSLTRPLGDYACRGWCRDTDDFIDLNDHINRNLYIDEDLYNITSQYNKNPGDVEDWFLSERARETEDRQLAWYLLRENVPDSSWLFELLEKGRTANKDLRKAKKKFDEQKAEKERLEAAASAGASSSETSQKDSAQSQSHTPKLEKKKDEMEYHLHGIKLVMMSAAGGYLSAYPSPSATTTTGGDANSTGGVVDAASETSASTSAAPGAVTSGSDAAQTSISSSAALASTAAQPIVPPQPQPPQSAQQHTQPARPSLPLFGNTSGFQLGIGWSMRSFDEVLAAAEEVGEGVFGEPDSDEEDDSRGGTSGKGENNVKIMEVEMG